MSFIPKLTGGNTGIPIYPTKSNFPSQVTNGYLVVAEDTNIVYTYDSNTSKYVVHYGPPVAIDITTPSNGLGLSGPSLTLSLASDSQPGALSSTDHAIYTNYGVTLGIHTSEIAVNTANISTNTSDISSNTANIASNTSAITLKAPLSSPTFTGDINSSTGSLLISSVGKTLGVKTGSNSKIGIVTLVSGSATVANTSVTPNSVILLTSQTDGGTPGFLRVSSITSGTGFTITSYSTLDTSTVAWFIVETIS